MTIFFLVTGTNDWMFKLFIFRAAKEQKKAKTEQKKAKVAPSKQKAKPAQKQQKAAPRVGGKR